MDAHERAGTKLCSVCGVEKPNSDFYATRKTRTCKACEKQLSKQRYIGNKEGKLQRCAEYRRANKAKIQAYMVRRYAETRDAWLVRCKEYRQRPEVQEQLRISGLKRRAKRVSRIRCATPAWADVKAIAKVYRLAQEMTVATGTPHSVDHIIPIGGRNVCGLHLVWNLRVILSEENARKGYKHE